jgi:hypothetical protein
LRIYTTSCMGPNIRPFRTMLKRSQNASAVRKDLRSEVFLMKELQNIHIQLSSLLSDG